MASLLPVLCMLEESGLGWFSLADVQSLDATRGIPERPFLTVSDPGAHRRCAHDDCPDKPFIMYVLKTHQSAPNRSVVTTGSPVEHLQPRSDMQTLRRQRTRQEQFSMLRRRSGV
ncbi:hypothetical protein UB44_05235 [Burkholderiaceae bacterium 26]|nr:hypothetical protein UB44_05235 [Burkholderiaceae bacterium 26]